jgi:hypothetical protein
MITMIEKNKIIIFFTCMIVFMLTCLAFSKNIIIISKRINCKSNVYNCSDFRNYNQAEKVFKHCYIYGDIHHLDADRNLIPCESLIK